MNPRGGALGESASTELRFFGRSELAWRILREAYESGWPFSPAMIYRLGPAYREIQRLASADPLPYIEQSKTAACVGRRAS